jgi:hypothetical protein
MHRAILLTLAMTACGAAEAPRPVARTMAPASPPTVPSSSAPSSASSNLARDVALREAQPFGTIGVSPGDPSAGEALRELQSRPNVASTRAFFTLLEREGFVDRFASLTYVTLFAPTDTAMAALPDEVRSALAASSDYRRLFVRAHLALQVVTNDTTDISSGMGGLFLQQRAGRLSVGIGRARGQVLFDAQGPRYRIFVVDAPVHDPKEILETCRGLGKCN